MTRELSANAFQKAQELIPGGVNSPVRAFKNVDATPVFYDHAKGSRIWDVDGNEYVDFICSWGPMLLGQANEKVIEAVQGQLSKGLSFGAPCMAEIELAKRICEMVPSAERVRMVSSGTEATMSAIRLARGWTGRDKLIKFDGNYHGHSDSLLVSAGSGVATFGIPDTPGVTAHTASDTLVVPYNNLDAVRETLEANEGQVACIIVEPVAGNMGVVTPEEGFLQGLRDLCTQHETVLIFDEVITGFRMGPGGAQEFYGIMPDLSTFGKIIGGGLPVGCIAGSADIMDHFSPVGPVYQAGTLSGNPLAMVAGCAMLDQLKDRALYEQLEAKGALLEELLNNAIAATGAPCTVNRAGSVATLFFSPTKVRNWDDAAKCDKEMFSRYFRMMLDEGYIIAPSQYEALFISSEHTEEDIRAFAAAAERTLRVLYAN